jgi:hypothetical protein
MTPEQRNNPRIQEILKGLSGMMERKTAGLTVGAINPVVAALASIDVLGEQLAIALYKIECLERHNR